MQLTSFINRIAQDISFLPKEAVTPLVCPESGAPILFMAYMISFLKEKNIMMETLEVTEIELTHLFSRLETSFLGMNMVYVLRGIEQREKKSRQQLLNYLAGYQGPHQVIFLCGKEDKVLFASKKDVIELPETVTAEMVGPLLSLFKKNSPAFAKGVTTLISKQNGLSLDQICMLIGYMQVVGKTDDYAQILDRVVEQEHSLFTLAQHFFAKSSTDFYKRWLVIHEHYPMTFWTVYWSEQLWRAYYVHYYLQKGQQAQAKSVSARLPFSFIQRDWKKSTLKELKNAHQWIYSLDNAHKNNIETEAGLDVFYNKFFLNEF